MKKALKEKEDNVIRLHFDLSYRKLQAIGMDEKLKEIDEELIKYNGELDIVRLKHNKEEITKMEDKVRELQTQKKSLTDIQNEIRFTEQTLKEAEKFIEAIRDCVKNPQEIYEELI